MGFCCQRTSLGLWTVQTQPDGDTPGSSCRQSHPFVYIIDCSSFKLARDLIFPSRSARLTTVSPPHISALGRASTWRVIRASTSPSHLHSPLDCSAGRRTTLPTHPAHHWPIPVPDPTHLSHSSHIRTRISTRNAPQIPPQHPHSLSPRSPPQSALIPPRPVQNISVSVSVLLSLHLHTSFCFCSSSISSTFILDPSSYFCSWFPASPSPHHVVRPR